jgi:hypothetical protein
VTWNEVLGVLIMVVGTSGVLAWGFFRSRAIGATRKKNCALIDEHYEQAKRDAQWLSRCHCLHCRVHLRRTPQMYRLGAVKYEHYICLRCYQHMQRHVVHWARLVNQLGGLTAIVLKDAPRLKLLPYPGENGFLKNLWR